MHIAILALARATRDLHHQRRLALDQAIQIVAHVLCIRERCQALAARQQFVHGLRAAQQQQAYQRELLPGKIQRLFRTVFVTLGT